MRNFNLKQQNISGAGAPGRGLSSAPWNDYNNTFLNTKVVPQDKDTQNGRSMIEMLGVLAIIGVLSVGGIAGYSKAITKYRINKTIEQITLIAGNVRAFFAPQRNYDGLGWCRNDNDATRAYCKLIKKAKLMPDEMWDDTDKRFNNVFGYDVQLYTANKSTSDDKQAFRIYCGLPGEEEICIELVSQDWSNSNVSFIQVGGGGPIAPKYIKLPISVDSAVNVCSDMISQHVRYGILFSITFHFDENINGDEWKNTSWQN